MIWIVDASVAVKWFLEDELHERADAVLKRWIDQPECFAVPELFCFEVFSVLCRMHPRGRDVFVGGVLPLIQGGVVRQPMTEELAGDAARFVAMGLTGYDACYAALARQMEGLWLTFDGRAHRRIAGEGGLVRSGRGTAQRVALGGVLECGGVSAPVRPVFVSGPA